MAIAKFLCSLANSLLMRSGEEKVKLSDDCGSIEMYE